jgi:hypothetical protein
MVFLTTRGSPLNYALSILATGIHLLLVSQSLKMWFFYLPLNGISVTERTVSLKYIFPYKDSLYFSINFEQILSWVQIIRKCDVNISTIKNKKIRENFYWKQRHFIHVPVVVKYWLLSFPQLPCIISSTYLEKLFLSTLIVSTVVISIFQWKYIFLGVYGTRRT